MEVYEINWLVAKATGRNPCPKLDNRLRVITGDGFVFGSPATQWDDCGRLISRYSVTFDQLNDRSWECSATIDGRTAYGRGKDHLQAACMAIINLELADPQLPRGLTA